MSAYYFHRLVCGSALFPIASATSFPHLLEPWGGSSAVPTFGGGSGVEPLYI
jgi:hypothetical protein